MERPQADYLAWLKYILQYNYAVVFCNICSDYCHKYAVVFLFIVALYAVFFIVPSLVAN